MKFEKQMIQKTEVKSLDGLTPDWRRILKKESGKKWVGGNGRRRQAMRDCGL